MSLCSRCGAAFSCGVKDVIDATDANDAPACWCMQLPALAALPASGACWCPDCLKEFIAVKTAATPEFAR